LANDPARASPLEYPLSLSKAVPPIAHPLFALVLQQPFPTDVPDDHSRPEKRQKCQRFRVLIEVQTTQSFRFGFYQGQSAEQKICYIFSFPGFAFNFTQSATFTILFLPLRIV
jgi:hypothetical protein